MPADIDGDSREDQVFHSWVKGAALLGVCTGLGQKDSRPGLGMSEMLQIIDLEGDRRDEIFFGSNSCCESWTEIAVVLKGHLKIVRRTDSGLPLTLRSGMHGPTLDEERETGRAFGCEDMNDDGIRDLVQVTAFVTDDHITWKKFAYELAGTRAREVARERGTVPKENGQLLSESAADLVMGCIP